ncbi:hypothetical protein AMTR_s03109p00006930, partial [Amborella trichopoda]
MSNDFTYKGPNVLHSYSWWYSKVCIGLTQLQIGFLVELVQAALITRKPRRSPSDHVTEQLQ